MGKLGPSEMLVADCPNPGAYKQSINTVLGHIFALLKGEFNGEHSWDNQDTLSNESLWSAGLPLA